MHFPYVLPLLAGLVFVAGAMFLKRASDLGADVWRTVRICNLTTAVLFLPLLLLGGHVPDPAPWGQPALVALLFVLGQVFTLLALRSGDVSVATPVLGLKIVLVALLTTVILGERLTGRLWVAAALSSVAIALLQVKPLTSRTGMARTIVMAATAAAAYALFDVLVQKWSSAWGMGRFLPALMGFVALYTVVLRPWKASVPRAPSRIAKPWVAAGAFCFALQGLLIVSAIALYGHATIANVFYSTRGLWSVIAVWFLGRWFSNHELEPRTFAWRLLGSALLMMAILLVLFDDRTRDMTAG